MNLVKLNKVEFEGETLHISDIPLSAVEAVVAFEESGNKDFTALSRLLKIVMREADGSPYKQFSKLSPEDLANVLPAATAVELFGKVSEVAMGKL